VPGLRRPMSPRRYRKHQPDSRQKTPPHPSAKEVSHKPPALRQLLPPARWKSEIPKTPGKHRMPIDNRLRKATSLHRPKRYMKSTRSIRAAFIHQINLVVVVLVTLGRVGR